VNWLQTNENIKYELSEIFAAGSPAFSNIDDSVELFRKIIYHITPDRELNGLSRALPAALQDAFVDKVGDINSLSIIADKIEPFLKKLAIISGKATVTSVKGLMLLPLIKLLNINSALSAPPGGLGANPQLDETNLINYKGASQYLEYICLAYLTRNAVHVSPAWRHSEVIERRNALITVCLYASLICKTDIDRQPDNRPGDEVIVNKIKAEEKYLYYFMSFGDSSNRIKNQIVTAYILQFIKENGTVAMDLLKSSVDTFFKNQMEPHYYSTIASTLQIDGKIVYDREAKTVELRSEERERIVRMQQSFEDDRNIFFLYLEDICNNFGIKAKVNEIFDHLSIFLESNYQIDIDEASSQGAKTKTNEDQCYKEFLSYLATVTGDNDVAKRLFADLANLSKDNDFLLKMSASRVFAKISNPDRFEHYLREHDRVLYLDTQIVLFALCLNYTNQDISYDNSFLQTTNDLFRLAEHDQSIEIKIPRQYLQEASYQLKLAVMLIPFEQMGGERLSGNVFYRFYYFLRNAGLLHKEDEKYADFILNNFFLKERDAYDHRYQDTAVRIIEDILETQFSYVEIMKIGEHSADAFDVIDEVLKKEGNKTKSPFVIANDAKMLHFLTEPARHDVEPFFLTWDKRWQDYRREYLDRYERLEAVSFHLFNPAKFINHYSLLKLKINPQAITNDLLSLMDSYSSSSKTDTVWDLLNRFTGIENIDQDTRRQYISFIVNLFRTDLNYSTADIDKVERSERIAVQMGDAMQKIHDHFYDKQGDFKLDDYRQAMLYQENFKGIATLVTQSINGTISTNTLLHSVDDIIREHQATSRS
jgi:hypothetical protein